MSKTTNTNKNGFKVGDRLMIEDAWEDEKGGRHDEPAEIQSIEKDGSMSLAFYEATDEINDFCRGMEYFANEYSKNDLLS